MAIGQSLFCISESILWICIFCFRNLVFISVSYIYLFLIVYESRYSHSQSRYHCIPVSLSVSLYPFSEFLYPVYVPLYPVPVSCILYPVSVSCLCILVSCFCIPESYLMYPCICLCASISHTQHAISLSRGTFVVPSANTQHRIKSIIK